MVQGTFVLSAYKKKGEFEKQRVSMRQTKMRYLVVAIAIFVVFGCEYCFDNASALEEPIEENLQLTTPQFNLLYSLYAFPNIIIPLLGGVIIDKYGARIALILSAMFCVLGQIIWGFGGYQNTFYVMLVGRVVFGIGGQVLHSSQNTLISHWFKASELSMVLGICLSFPKMGSSLNAFVTPRLSTYFEEEGEHMNVAGPIFVGAVLMSLSLGLAIILAYIDRKSESSVSMILQSDSKSQLERQKSNEKDTEVKLLVTSHLGEERGEGQDGQHINCKEISKLPVAFWLILLISMLSEALFIPFLDNGNAYYKTVFGLDKEQAGVYLILPYCVSSFFVIIFGYIVDRVKKRSYALIASCGFFTFTYLFMMLIESTQALRSNELMRWMPSLLLGICIAIFCSIIVPTVPMLISPKLLGTGFGLMEMLQNLALGVFPLIGAALQQSKQTDVEGFHLQTSFFFLISCLCLGVSIILKGIDLTSGRRLDVKDFRKHYLQKFLKEGSEQK